MRRVPVDRFHSVWFGPAGTRAGSPWHVFLEPVEPDVDFEHVFTTSDSRAARQLAERIGLFAGLEVKESFAEGTAVSTRASRSPVGAPRLESLACDVIGYRERSLWRALLWLLSVFALVGVPVSLPLATVFHWLDRSETIGAAFFAASMAVTASYVLGVAGAAAVYRLWHHLGTGVLSDRRPVRPRLAFDRSAGRIHGSPVGRTGYLDLPVARVKALRVARDEGQGSRLFGSDWRMEAVLKEPSGEATVLVEFRLDAVLRVHARQLGLFLGVPVVGAERSPAAMSDGADEGLAGAERRCAERGAGTGELMEL
jgi:hypothetical protein